jgi:dihydropteroate synthase
MVADGADIIDIGGESTRPGRKPEVDAEEECRRVLPVVREVRRRLPNAILSVDTYKGEVARRALDEGADIINDIYALRHSPEIAALVARAGAGLLLMHMQGDPETMQQNPQYADPIVDIKTMLRERMDFALAQGVAEPAIAVDPGIGFGKTVEHNVRILAQLEYLRLLQRPICVGPSRKGFLGVLTGGLPVDAREEATIAACCAAVMAGAGIVRVHNVRGVRRALAVVDAIRTCR